MGTGDCSRDECWPSLVAVIVGEAQVALEQPPIAPSSSAAVVVVVKSLGSSPMPSGLSNCEFADMFV